MQWNTSKHDYKLPFFVESLWESCVEREPTEKGPKRYLYQHKAEEKH